MNRPVAFFSMVMSIVFIALGIIIPIRPRGMFQSLPQYTLILMGLLLIAYGIFRFYRAYKMINKKD